MTDILLKRGSTSAILSYVGKTGEIVLDSSTNHIIIQDGTTKGGIKVANIDDIKGNDHYVTETYVNGNSWYRIWTDGFKEQGGILTGATNTTITFLMRFSTTPTVNFIVQRNTSPDNESSGHWIKTITSFNFVATTNWSSTPTKVPIHWIAFGY